MAIMIIFLQIFRDHRPPCRFRLQQAAPPALEFGPSSPVQRQHVQPQVRQPEAGRRPRSDPGGDEHQRFVATSAYQHRSGNFMI